MELRHLRYFVAVAEEQNVTRAAARLHVSQPPVSRQIRDLEGELGIALFEHGAKSVRLTEAGRAFLEKARLVLQQAEDAVQTARAVAKGEMGELHIGYAPSLTVELLPDALRLFQEAHPGVRVQLHDLSTQDLLRGLRKGQLHVAYLVQVSPKILAEFIFEEIRRYPVCVALPPAHPLARTRRPVGLEQVAREPLIAFTLADYPEHHLWLSELFTSINRPLKIREEHDSVASLITAVEAGRGVALVLETFKCFSPRVKVRTLVPPPPPLVVGIARLKGNSSPATKNFMTAARRAKL